MEALGLLASGIAHDFNNLLTVINGQAGLLLDGDNLDPAAKAGLQRIAVAGGRAASLTRQLLLLGRQQALQPRTVDLGDVVDSAAGLLRRVIGEDICIDLSKESGLPPIEADPAMIEQVLINLAANARDAMPDGGTLAISTGRVRLSRRDLASMPRGRPGIFVRLRVRDTGSGVAPQIRDRLFEPFFTTKEEGRGTGLGLATVDGIVSEHQGWIVVESEPGCGATFDVYFPASNRALPAAASVRASPAAGLPRDRTGETVLCVEDDALVREFATSVLAQAGYRVLPAATAAEAIDHWKWHSAQVELLLADVILPGGVSGFQLAERLRREKPGLKLLCVSGYGGPVIARLTAPPETTLLPKPYGPGTLLRAVRTVLSGG